MLIGWYSFLELIWVILTVKWHIAASFRMLKSTLKVRVKGPNERMVPW